MYYITIRQSPAIAQMTVEELLFGDPNKNYSETKQYSVSGTRTLCVDQIPDRLKEAVSVYNLIDILKRFNEKYDHLHVDDMSQLYRTFYIPKKHGGLRRIDAPNDDLMVALRELKVILENDFGALYHTSAFAYVKKRCTIDAVKRHQQNESRWFGKFDLSNFFGSTTIDFVMKQLSMIYPFSILMEVPAGEHHLRTAIELGFLNGGLPQGTPLSPTLTNIMMIPIDYKLFKEMRNHKMQNGQSQSFVYTRYADDFLVSSKYGFDIHDIESVIRNVLNEFDAPFKLNESKTRYGNSNGRNWNLGVMLNKDNQITVGYKNKKHFKSMLIAYATDKNSGKCWSLQDVQVLAGLRSYYRCVEKETIDSIISFVNEKFNIDVWKCMKEDLSTLTA